MLRRLGARWGLVVALLATGCEDPVEPDAGAQPDASEVLDAGFEPEDAGAPDAEPQDAEPQDAEPQDAEPEDGGLRVRALGLTPAATRSENAQRRVVGRLAPVGGSAEGPERRVRGSVGAPRRGDGS